MNYVSCFCCGRQYPNQFTWYICDRCGYRICANCIMKHHGPYNSVGVQKCSQCVSEYLRSSNNANG